MEMTKTVLSHENDGGFIAAHSIDNTIVVSKDKLPVVFDTLKAGKSYMKKRFGENWTDYCFKMARYNLQAGEPVACV